jgi:hypothetical protein
LIDDPPMTAAAEAAEQINSAVSRFYEIAAAWKASPTLDVVGTFAKKPGRKGPRLDGSVINVIQSTLPGLVKADEDAKISVLVARLTAEPALQGMSMPHVNTLRTMVEREKRRLKGERQVGGRPGLDASACELLRPDGTHHILFAIVDRTSGVILGFAVGDLTESRAAYARAAQDMLDRVKRGTFAALPWSDVTTRIDVIVGADAGAWKVTRAEYTAKHRDTDFGLVEKGRRYGRYLKLIAGDAIGEIRLFPARTELRDQVATGNRYTDIEALSAIEVEVARHNDLVLASNVAQGAPRPPPATIRVMEFIASDFGH